MPLKISSWCVVRKIRLYEILDTPPIFQRYIDALWQKSQFTFIDIQIRCICIYTQLLFFLLLFRAVDDIFTCKTTYFNTNQVFIWWFLLLFLFSCRLIIQLTFCIRYMWTCFLYLWLCCPFAGQNLSDKAAHARLGTGAWMSLVVHAVVVANARESGTSSSCSGKTIYGIF